MSAIMSICPKCARFKVHRVCPFCNVQQVITNISLDEVMKMTDKEKEELVNHYIETLIKYTYDPKAREYRETNERPVFAGYVHNSLPKCPTCQSTNVEKISLTSKVVGGALFGLFSSNVRKTMHCRNCGYKW